MIKENTSQIYREAKSQLARLMANENLTIEHRAVRTASFNTDSRVLTLPIWTDMTGDIYDTLVGHEVGHALDTPAGTETILSAIKSIDAQNMHGAKMFLNVVEDARIEKIVRRRYPGMRRSFSLGYKQLLDRNFFGTIGRDLKTYKLIDRVNLYFKLGSAAIIDFSPKEMELVRMVDNSESFEDVVAAAKALYEHAKLHNENQPDEDDDQDEGFDMYPDDNGSYYMESESSDEDEEEESNDETDSISDESDEGDESDESDESDEGDEGDESMSKSESDDEENGSDDEDSDSDGTSDTEDEPIDDVGTAENNPTSETQESWENQKNKLLSGEVRGYQYCNIPEVDGHKWIVPYKQIHYGNGKTGGGRIEGLSTVVQRETWSGLRGPNEAERFAMLNKFKNENAPIISFMVKEFEMRKAAEQYARQSIAKTGVINTNKLHTYKYNDDIFRRITNVPTGKNHGLVLILDWSGSMSDQITGTIEQLINMALFCRRVQIPFEVFAFSDGYQPYPEQANNFKYDNGDMKITLGLSLLQLLSSTMKPKELNDAMGNLLALGENFKPGDSGSRPIGYFRLNGTPLDGALLCLPSIVNAFRKRNKLQIVNTIILTDGENSYSPEINDKTYDTWGNKVLVVRDKVSKAEYTCAMYGGEELTKILLKNLEDRTNANVIGYYLVSGSIRALKRTISSYFPDDFENAFNRFNEKRYVEITSKGYTYYYVIKGNSLQIEAEELNIGRATSAKAIAKAFGKYSKNKLDNRVMLSRFIEKISA